jgi:hypothetical protein
MPYLESVGAYVCNCQPIKKMKGAFIRAYWNDRTDDTETFDAYVSFGTFNHSSGTDEFGMQDSEIFFYFPKGVEDMEEECLRASQEDFTIISYEQVGA